MPTSQTASFSYFLLYLRGVSSHLFSVDLTHPKTGHKGSLAEPIFPPDQTLCLFIC